ncbi:OmpA family protein [Xanthocytophaga flavus]|uniref:OmpA family protein n=1 Tax=Xanthocytophaga flava TaxID=3048013 RepID=UPI0028D805DE|nr:OmpA family protein [Xanthocytophaga flavus]
MKHFCTYLYLLFIYLTLFGGACWQQAKAQQTEAREVRASLPESEQKNVDLPKQYQKLLVLSDTYFQYGQYDQALKYYGQIAAVYPDNLYISYQLAECQRQLFNYTEAEALFKKVYQADSVKYPEAFFYYGLAQKINGKYTDAIRTFSAFQKYVNDQQIYAKQQWLDRARLEQAGCQYALTRANAIQGNFQFKLLPGYVNTSGHDYAPVLIGQNDLVAITSTRIEKKADTYAPVGSTFSDIYIYTRQRDSTYHAFAHPLDDINTFWSEGSGFLTEDGKKFYFTRCPVDGDCSIYVTERKGDKWTKPVRLTNLINQPQTDSRHPALTASGDTLYFVSNRKDGFGMNDIWMSIQTEKGKWQAPINLGNKVNTPYNDISPFYYASENQLFFASEGHVGFGGLDLYYVNTSPDHTKDTIINLGAPFNSSRDDAFLVLGKATGYMASNREGGFGNFDIYSFLARNQQSEFITVLPGKDSVLNALPLLIGIADAQKQVLDRIIGKKEAEKLYKTTLPLSEEEKQFYQTLSPEQKDQIENTAGAFMNRESASQRIAKDAFVYEKLASQKDSARVKRIIEAYRKAQQDNSALVLSEEDKAYYESKGSEERNELYRQIAGVLSNQLTDETVKKLQQDAYEYERLPAEEKDRINRMAAARYAAQLNNYDEKFREEDKFFYEKLSSESKDRMERLIIARMGQLRDSQDASLLTEEDKAYYEKLSPEEKQRINRMAAVRYDALVNEREEKYQDKDNYHYEKLSPEEKDRMNRLLAARNPANSQKLDLTDQSVDKSVEFEYEKLTPEEKNRINRIAAARYASKMNGTDEVLKEEDGFFYEKLSPEEKKRIDRLVTTRMGVGKEVLDPSVLTDEDKSYYEKLSPEEKRRIDRMAATKLTASPDTSDTKLTKEDAFFYEKLSPEEKNRINRLMVARNNANHQLVDESLLESGDLNTYQEMPSEEKDRINRMTAARYAARMNGKTEKFTDEDTYFYEKLSPEEKERMDRIMSARAARKGIFQDQSALNGDEFAFKRLPAESTNKRFSKSGLASNTSLIADNSVLSPILFSDALVSLNTSYLDGKYTKITLSGQLMEVKTKQPMATSTMLLTDEKGKILQTIVPNADGTFQFQNITVQGVLTVRLEMSSNSSEEGKVIYTRDLKLIANEETPKLEVFGVAYFDFNSYTLGPKTIQLLESLLKYYKQNPAIRIEFNVFADEAGSYEYNLALTRKRGVAIQDYLQARGISPKNMAVYARGEQERNLNKPPQDIEARKVIISVERPNAITESPQDNFFILQTPVYLK